MSHLFFFILQLRRVIGQLLSSAAGDLRERSLRLLAELFDAAVPSTQTGDLYALLAQHLHGLRLNVSVETLASLKNGLQVRIHETEYWVWCEPASLFPVFHVDFLFAGPISCRFCAQHEFIINFGF